MLWSSTTARCHTCTVICRGTADDPVLYPSGWSADCTDDQGTAFSLSVPSRAHSL